MEDNKNNSFSIEPSAELDSMVFAKVAPVLKQNKQIYSNKRWFQLWMPAASTVALTAFGVWFLNKKSKTVPGDSDTPVAVVPPEEVDLQAFASMDLDEESLDIASDLEIIEDLELLESYSEDDENS